MKDRYPTIPGCDLRPGDVTTDGVGNLYVVLEVMSNGAIRRRDLIRGEPVGRVYCVSASSDFMIVRRES